MLKDNINKIKMEDKFEEFACLFKNESVCAEELDAEDLEFWDVEISHFEEEY